jgi:hypothetical protein
MKTIFLSSILAVMALFLWRHAEDVDIIDENLSLIQVACPNGVLELWISPRMSRRSIERECN